jgi:Domain of unknown function (DUF4296)
MFRDQAKFSFKRGIYQLIVSGLVFIFLLSACSPEKPVERLLTEQEMVNVLMEIYLTESKISRVSISNDSIKKIFPRFEAKILEKMNVSDSAFHRSMEYYIANPKQLEHIYTALVDSLNLKAQSKAAPAK